MATTAPPALEPVAPFLSTYDSTGGLVDVADALALVQALIRRALAPAASPSRRWAPWIWRRWWWWWRLATAAARRFHAHEACVHALPGTLRGQAVAVASIAGGQARLALAGISVVEVTEAAEVPAPPRPHTHTNTHTRTRTRAQHRH